jgi:hypothetical protein
VIDELSSIQGVPECAPVDEALRRDQRAEIPHSRIGKLWPNKMINHPPCNHWVVRLARPSVDLTDKPTNPQVDGLKEVAVARGRDCDLEVEDDIPKKEGSQLRTNSTDPCEISVWTRYVLIL